MKIKLVRTKGFFPQALPKELREQCEVHRPTIGHRIGKPDVRYVDVPKGTIMDQAWSPLLANLWSQVLCGDAVPADKECEDICKAKHFREQKIADAIEYSDRLNRGQVTGNPEIDAPDDDNG